MSPRIRTARRETLHRSKSTFASAIVQYSLLASALLLAPASAQVDLVATGGTPVGSYATLKAAFDAVNAGTHKGGITIAIVGDTTETAPVVLNASGTGSASYTSILLTPMGNVARTISGAIAAGSPLLDLNGADNVTIDGQNSGGNSLTLVNTTVSAVPGTSTIRFVGGATHNVITNSIVQGASSSSVATDGGTIFFSTDSVTASGNDDNTISNNDIGPVGANLPSKAILCNGSTSTTAIGNSGNVIHNNNIFDFFAAAVTSSGVATNGGCNTWTITNNRLYQTGTRTWTTGAIHRGIDINNATATSGAQSFTITGNIVGFASNSQTGTYTLTGSNGKFHGIQFNGITGGVSSTISNNAVASVSLTGVTSSGTSTSTPFVGLLVTNGLATTNSNVIGNWSAIDSLTFSTTTTGATDIYGIFNFSFDDWTANSNSIGRISVTNLGAGGTFVLFGMRANTVQEKAFYASANTVGGVGANSLQLTSTGNVSQVIGMSTVNAASTWSGNIVRNLTNNNGTGTTSSASVIGLFATTALSNHTFTANTVYGLANTNPTAATSVIGILLSGATSNLVHRNLVYGLTTGSSSPSAEITGIRPLGGITIYRNNMIAVGAGTANAIGSTASNASASGINGILDAGGTNTFLHNSVYVGGSATAGGGASYAFNGTQLAVARIFRDNIFWNARTNAGATGKHYAVKVNGTAPNPAGLTIDNNLYLSNGNGAVFGFYNSQDVANLPAWRLALGQDERSVSGHPQFNDPNGGVPDLHIHPSNASAAERNGEDVGVLEDFDGQLRSSLTPVDIGADAGSFSPLDLLPPSIAFAAFSNTSLTTDRVLTATLADINGVATGSTPPQIYYRKNAGSYTSRPCSLAGGTVSNGTWSCNVVHSDVGGVAAGDAISYFVIAQDTVGNVGSRPSGVTATDVNTVTLPPPAPGIYTIGPAFSGTLAVGSGETYTSLTNAGGLFEAINGSALTGNLVIQITSDLAGELGTHALNQWFEDGVGAYTLLIQPSGAPRLVSGSNAGALFRFNGVDRLTVDGSTSGATATGIGGNALLRELTFQNTHAGTSAVVMSLESGANGAQNNTIRNVVLRGQDPTTTFAGLTLGGSAPGTAGADNDNNRVENIAVQRVILGIYSSGASAANPNTGTVVTRNDLSAAGGDRVRRVGIVVFNEAGPQITENRIGALSTNESLDGVAIGVGAQSINATSTSSGGVTNALVARNQIDGVESLSVTGFSAVGIAVAGDSAGPNTIANNMISGVTAPSTSPDLVAGIWVAGVPGSATRIYDNTVSLAGDRGSVVSQVGSYALAITGTDPAVEVKGNIFANSQTTTGGGANAKSYAIGTASATLANLDTDFNDFFASGPSAGYFRTGTLGTVGTDFATLAAWQAAVLDDANSLEVDPLLTSATDLHLSSSSPMIDEGVVLAGVATDIDGDPRTLSTPDIGADEVPKADLSITKTDGATSEIPGTPVTYTLVASNAGPSPTAATVTDTFTASLSGCSTTCVASGGATCNAGPVAGDLNEPVTLPVGGSATFTATCTISLAATGTLVNTASVSSTAFDPNAGNNSATDSDTLVAAADVSITKTDGATIEIPGTPVTYTLVVSNAGPAAAPTVTVVDTFAAILTGCSTTCTPAGGASCTAGPISGNLSTNANLPVGGSATYTATCNISAVATGSLVNTATATVGGGVSDPATGNNSATDTDTLDSMPFVDGFETGDTSRWTSTVPLTFETYDTVTIADGSSAVDLVYDFSAVKSGEALLPSPIAVVTGAAGKPLFLVVARRTSVAGQLELSLEVAGSANTSWISAGEVPQQVRVEWSATDASNMGHVAIYLDGRLALWVDGFSSGTPTNVKLLRAPAPNAAVAP